jgi:hypothetical protein
MPAFRLYCLSLSTRRLCESEVERICIRDFGLADFRFAEFELSEGSFSGNRHSFSLLKSFQNFVHMHLPGSLSVPTASKVITGCCYTSYEFEVAKLI